MPRSLARFCKVSRVFTPFNKNVCKSANCSKTMQYTDVNRSKNVVKPRSDYYCLFFLTSAIINLPLIVINRLMFLTSFDKSLPKVTIFLLLKSIVLIASYQLRSSSFDKSPIECVPNLSLNKSYISTK